MNKAISHIDATKYIKLSANAQKNLHTFLELYVAPDNEAALLKDVPNTPLHLKFIKLFRKVAVRENITKSGGFAEKFVYRLKGRSACRRWSKASAPRSSILNEEADRFALYAHTDYQY